MGVIKRAVAVIAWLIGVAVYLLVIGGAGGFIWDFMTGMPAVTEGPFWETAQRYKTLATWVVPAILILGPLFYWLLGGIREEADEQVKRVRPP
jgi:heme/copper-type cytochrome/quinol oxidase subunit 2